MSNNHSFYSFILLSYLLLNAHINAVLSQEGEEEPAMGDGALGLGRYYMLIIMVIVCGSIFCICLLVQCCNPRSGMNRRCHACVDKAVQYYKDKKWHWERRKEQKRLERLEQMNNPAGTNNNVNADSTTTTNTNDNSPNAVNLVSITVTPH